MTQLCITCHRRKPIPKGKLMCAACAIRQAAKTGRTKPA